MKSKKMFAIIAICSSLMFLWIFVTVALTGEREISEFTKRDTVIFIGFIIVEILTLIFMLVNLAKFTRERIKESNEAISSVSDSKTKAEKITNRRYGVLLVFCVCVSFAAQIAGIMLKANKVVYDAIVEFSPFILLSCIVIPLTLLGLSYLFDKILHKKMNSMNVAESQKFILSHREAAKETAEKKLSFLKKWIALGDSYAVCFFLIAIATSVFSGIIYDGTASPLFLFYAVFLLQIACNRIRFPFNESVLENDKLYISPKKYPIIYDLAKKAANTMNCSGKIRISLTSDNNAGIVKVGKVNCIQLGVLLLKLYSEDELYNVLLHEFAHVDSDNSNRVKIMNYADWMVHGGTRVFNMRIARSAYRWIDSVFGLNYELYLYASSIINEIKADESIVKYGNKEVAVSALTKLRYYDFYDWESGTYDRESLFVSEKLDKLYLTRILEEFKKAVEKNHHKWDELIMVEINSRSATHPTLKKRIEVLGYNEPFIIKVSSSPEYSSEVDRAFGYVEELIYEDRKKDYKEFRQKNYLDLLEKIDNWKEGGSVLIPEEYRDIVSFHFSLGKATEGYALCLRAIEELSEQAAAYAYYMAGAYLIHKYDSTGLDYIYKAMEINTNYINEGLDMIGTFCCITGNQEELDIYRERVLVFAQDDKDKYSKISEISKDDKLVKEELPEELFSALLAYIEKVDDGSIHKVYLIRKVITVDYFTSFVIIDFKLGSDEEDCSQIMHQIFSFLDTVTDWQFSLLDYRSVPQKTLKIVNQYCIYTGNN